MNKFEVYRDRAGAYRWRLKASNGEIVAVGEGYTTKQNAINAANWIKTKAAYADIYDLT